MKKIPALFLLFGLVLLSTSARSESIFAVNAVNYPVWVERDEQFLPVAPGDELKDGDVVNTGRHGRAWLSMSDGSMVKLGKETRFEITAAGYPQEGDNSVLTATLDVVRGAFRFTTSFLLPERESGHEINISIGAITANISGTDIWARSTIAEDSVILLEGSISVEAEGEPVAYLFDPLSFYLKERGQAPEPVKIIDIETVDELAVETELSFDLGIATTEGKYQLVFMSALDAANLNELRQIIRQQGYAARPVTAEVDGVIYTRLVLPGFESLETAVSAAELLKAELLLPSIWINKL
jgi:hypothetical protein